MYANGEVCISILHPPGDDPNHYESASERWSPIQSVEKILISVMSMLAVWNLLRVCCGRPDYDIRNPTMRALPMSKLQRCGENEGQSSRRGYEKTSEDL